MAWKRLAEDGGFAQAVGAIILGLMFATRFVRRQMALDDPMLDLRLFRRPALAAALIINILDFFVGFGILIVVAQFPSWYWG